MSKFTDIVLGFFKFLLPMLKATGKDELKKILQNLKVKDPVAYKTVVTSLYGPIDVHLESIADASDNDIDNLFVDTLKEALEESATANGIVLQNLDAD